LNGEAPYCQAVILTKDEKAQHRVSTLAENASERCGSSSLCTLRLLNQLIQERIDLHPIRLL
jgi:hypothetical protein